MILLLSLLGYVCATKQACEFFMALGPSDIAGVASEYLNDLSPRRQSRLSIGNSAGIVLSSKLAKNLASFGLE